MTKQSSSASLASMWNEPGWAAFYEARRATTRDIYPSEWLFLKEHLTESVSVLDIGCAVGGLAAIFAEHVADFRYTGLDVSLSMIERAREKHPRHRFEVIDEADLSILAAETFDLVVCLGVLHLSRRWRELMAAAWHCTAGSLLFDLRETIGGTIEDETSSYYSVGALLGTGAEARLPYNIINTTEALGMVMRMCGEAAGIRQYGYLASVSPSAVTPVRQVLMHTYHVQRKTR